MYSRLMMHVNIRSTEKLYYQFTNHTETVLRTYKTAQFKVELTLYTALS